MILITGGTGFVGQTVVRELLALGYKVRLLVRDPERAARFQGDPRVEVIQGDALRPETLPAAMAGAHGVVHLIGIIAETSRVTFEQAHVEATRNLLAAAKPSGVTRWVQVSAVGTRNEARSRYHKTKWQAEELARQSGLDWTIFRPSLIYGTREQDRLLRLLRTLLSWPVDLLLFKSFPLLNGGRVLIQPVSVNEVAHCVARAMAKEASIGQTYELVGPVAMSWREMILKVAHFLGQKCSYEEIPLMAIFRALFWLLLGLLPLAIGWGWYHGKLNLAGLELAVGFWAVLVLAASRRSPLILFSVPSAPLRTAGELLRDWLPRSLQFSEQLKMAEEDNVGDPGPAARTFSYAPESFEQGMARVLGS
jgi:NADH dehydrogenase